MVVKYGSAPAARASSTKAGTVVVVRVVCFSFVCMSTYIAVLFSLECDCMLVTPGGVSSFPANGAADNVFAC